MGRFTTTVFCKKTNKQTNKLQPRRRVAIKITVTNLPAQHHLQSYSTNFLQGSEINKTSAYHILLLHSFLFLEAKALKKFLGSSYLANSSFFEMKRLKRDFSFTD